MALGDRQKQHYEAIHDAYEDHYYDEASMAYRRRFYYEPMFAGLDLGDADVVDLASGSGHNSVEVLRRWPSARPTGVDISDAACAAYRRRVGRPAIQADLTKGVAVPTRFDVAMIFGGLHHCVYDLDGALRTVATLLKPGGLFLMLEPNRSFVLEGLRRLWYRHDAYFDASTEASLDHDVLARQAAGLFMPLDVRYLGGPGYFLIAQSLVFRMPKRVKNLLAPGLITADAVYNRLPGRLGYPYFIARWKRRGAVGAGGDAVQAPEKN
jgi:SAM-dependent methyltransferase